MTTWTDRHCDNVCPVLFLSERLKDRILLPNGIEPLFLPPFSALPSPVADHPDMLIYTDKRRLITYSGYYAAHPTLLERSGLPIQTIPNPPTPTYPYDIGLNFLRIGQRIFGRCDHMHSALAQSNELSIFVRQGYARCATCLIGDYAAITADPSIEKALRRHEIDVLKIRPGAIRIDGYDSGFIGGASVQLGHQIGFFGDLSMHPDASSMKAFMQKYGFEPVCLCPGTLTDFGGGILL